MIGFPLYFPVATSQASEGVAPWTMTGAASASAPSPAARTRRHRARLTMPHPPLPRSSASRPRLECRKRADCLAEQDLGVTGDDVIAQLADHLVPQTEVEAPRLG